MQHNNLAIETTIELLFIFVMKEELKILLQFMQHNNLAIETTIEFLFIFVMKKECIKNM